MTIRNHQAIADKWAADVLTGKIPSGTRMRRAIERHHRDLTRVGQAGFPYIYSDLGARICRFIERFLCHVEAAEDLVGKPLILSPAHCFFLTSAFGWVHRETKRPRFRTIELWCPKGSAKSTISAAIVAYFLSTGKGSDTLVSAATTRDQASLVFNFSRRMVLNGKDSESGTGLEKKFGLRVLEREIQRPMTGSVFKAISSEARSVEGKLPKLMVVDECHCHPSRELWDNLRSMLPKRPDSQLLSISTAGMDTSPGAIGYEVYQDACAVLDGHAQDDTLYALIWEADPKADPWNGEALRQANPMLGISIDPSAVQAEAEQARRVTSQQASYFTKRLGWWVTGGEAWLSPELWAACQCEVKREDYLGRQCVIGLDLANRSDLVCKSLLFPESDGSYALFVDSYINAREAKESVNAPLYQEWIKAGWLHIAGDVATDLDVVESAIFDDAAKYQVAAVSADPTEARQLLGHLAAKQIQTVEVRTTFVDMNDPLKLFEALIRQTKIRTPADPCLAWQIGNVDLAHQGDHVRPVKRNGQRQNKIDGAVAAINALREASILGLGSTSPYTADRGLFTIDVFADDSEDEFADDFAMAG